MKREIIETRDGSTSIFLPHLNETYHSKNGAIQEAYHVFIKNGLSLFKQKEIAVLEIGFGTGLNALITLLESEKNTKKIDYVGIEAYPITVEEALKMNYAVQLKTNPAHFLEIHTSIWNQKIQITNYFSILKRQQFFENICDENRFDLIYFDAFGFQVQPNLWSIAIFEKMYKALKKNGVLVTYACRTPIKKAMLGAGFSIEKLPGAPGKREMLRATKN